MAPQVASDDKKAGEEVYHGTEDCRKKTMELLEQVGLPNGLILLDDIQELLDDIQECRYDKTTGRVWMKRDKKVEHEIKAIGRLVQYDTEISGYVEQHKMKKVRGVKIKDLLVWITISEISIDDPATANICFKGVFEIEKNTIAKKGAESNIAAITKGAETKKRAESNIAAITKGAETKKRAENKESDRVITAEMRFSVGA